MPKSDKKVVCPHCGTCSGEVEVIVTDIIQSSRYEIVGKEGDTILLLLVEGTTDYEEGDAATVTLRCEECGRSFPADLQYEIG